MNENIKTDFTNSFSKCKIASLFPLLSNENNTIHLYNVSNVNGPYQKNWYKHFYVLLLNVVVNVCQCLYINGGNVERGKEALLLLTNVTYTTTHSRI